MLTKEEIKLIDQMPDADRQEYATREMRLALKHVLQGCRAAKSGRICMVVNHQITGEPMWVIMAGHEPKTVKRVMELDKELNSRDEDAVNFATKVLL